MMEKCFALNLMLQVNLGEVITRYKKTVRGTEESVLDYFVVCQELFQNIMKMYVDEQRKYVLTRFYKHKTDTSTVDSDHNVMVLYFSFKWCPKKKWTEKKYLTSEILSPSKYLKKKLQ